MTDFAGILNDMRSTVSSLSEFFDHSTGQAIAKGLAGGSVQPNNSYKLREAEELASRHQVPYSERYGHASDYSFGDTKAVSYNDVEAEWMSRLRKFSNIDSAVK